MDTTERAQAFKALGDPTRVRIIEFLLCCPQCGTFDEAGGVPEAKGATAGEVCCSLFGDTKAASKVSFHLKELRLAGLIQVERQGKQMVCSLRPETLRHLATFLSKEPGNCAPGCCT